MRPVKVPPAGVEELRAAVKAFADNPGPARFSRVCKLLERHAPPDRASDPRRLP
jgi:hypothetical protein